MSLDLRKYMIRRKVIKIFGASFHILDPEGRVVGFSSQKAFKLKEDIRIFTDESRSTELLAITARQIVDFSAAYDIVDSQAGRKIGAARRKGWSSIMRDSWELLDDNDRPIAQLSEDSALMALLRRFLGGWIPQSFHISTPDGRRQADLSVRFNPFVYKLEVELADDCTIDPTMVLATAVLIAAIEQRQQ